MRDGQFRRSGRPCGNPAHNPGVTTNMVHINPMLNLLGFHLYQITEAGNEYALIARRRVRRGEYIKACKISSEVLLGKRANDAPSYTSRRQGHV